MNNLLKRFIDEKLIDKTAKKAYYRVSKIALSEITDGDDLKAYLDGVVISLSETDDYVVMTDEEIKKDIICFQKQMV